MKKIENTQCSEGVTQRRSFLKGAAVTTAAVGSGALAANVMASDNEAVKVRPEKLGYQETAHIKEYYRLARF